jgi:hypothetical protein
MLGPTLPKEFHVSRIFSMHCSAGMIGFLATRSAFTYTSKKKLLKNYLLVPSYTKAVVLHNSKTLVLNFNSSHIICMCIYITTSCFQLFPNHHAPIVL